MLFLCRLAPDSIALRHQLDRSWRQRLCQLLQRINTCFAMHGSFDSPFRNSDHARLAGGLIEGSVADMYDQLNSSSAEVNTVNKCNLYPLIDGNAEFSVLCTMVTVRSQVRANVGVRLGDATAYSGAMSMNLPRWGAAEPGHSDGRDRP